jgi:hypothetical protein
MLSTISVLAIRPSTGAGRKESMILRKSVTVG